MMLFVVPWLSLIEWTYSFWGLAGAGAGAGAGSPTTSIAGIYFLGLQMARKYKINGKTLALTFAGIGETF